MQKNYHDGYHLSNKQRKYLEEIHRYSEIPISAINYSNGMTADCDHYSSEHLEGLEQSEERYAEDYHEELYEAIKLLTIKQQAIVLLYLHGLKSSTIAKHLKLSNGMITMALHGNYIYKNGVRTREGGIIKSLSKKIKKR